MAGFFEGLNVKDVLDVFAGVNAANIAKGTAKSQNLVMELKAQAELETVRGQNELARWMQMSQAEVAGVGITPALMLGAVAIVGLGLVLVIRK